VQVAAERRLAVRARRSQLERRAADLGAMVEERGDRRVAGVLERQRRHCHPRLIGQQRDDARGVASLDGVAE
jgi:hypothetical protein